MPVILTKRQKRKRKLICRRKCKIYAGYPGDFCKASGVKFDKAPQEAKPIVGSGVVARYTAKFIDGDPAKI